MKTKMTSAVLLPLIGVILLAHEASAQGLQNLDMSMLAGATSFGSREVAGSGVTVYGATAACSSFRYGYQVARVSAASLWIELGQGTFVIGGSSSGSLPGIVNNGIFAFTAGLRLMIPVQSRISVYGALAGGGGNLTYPAIRIADGGNPILGFNSTWHGVFDIGGGLDLRFTQRMSLRFELRDLVSGKGLSGSAGRHHLLPMMGISFH